MNLLVENKPHLFGFILKNGNKIGSCVPFRLNDSVYVITCGHVLYGYNLEDDISSDDTMEVETAYGKYSFTSIISHKQFSTMYDLAIVKICAEHTLDLFLELEFSSLSVNPLLMNSFVLITKQFDDEYLADVQSLSIEKNDVLEKFNSIVKFEKNTFLDHYITAYASDAFKGVSGSGLFYNNGNKIILSGIIKSLETSKINSYATFIDVDLVSGVLDSLPIFDINQLDKDRSVISQIIKDCIDETQEESVSNWINDNSNEAKHIVRKLSALYNEDEVKEEVNKVVNNLLNGDRLVEEWKQNNNSIYKVYEESKYVTENEHLKYTVDCKSNAQSAYRGLLKDHKDILKDSFGGLNGIKVPLRESAMVANRDLSQWLAICDLDFKIE